MSDDKLENNKNNEENIDERNYFHQHGSATATRD